ncbi:MAG: RrF2 family transcriptional regulator [Pirellulaceae bacterium]
MLTKTSLSAIRVITYLGLHGGAEPLSPRYLAEQLGDSPTYLAKVVRHLVKVRILRAHRGVTGGVVLAKAPADITLLAIVEACQGEILANFCENAGNLSQTCAFHQAAAELHNAVVAVLTHWTAADLLKKPQPSKSLHKRVKCCLQPNFEAREFGHRQ